jgi:hypothetical protein
VYVIATFQYSTDLELAISELEKNNIPRHGIAAVPLAVHPSEEEHILDTIHRHDNQSLLDNAAVLATIYSVVSASWGFEKPMGPIMWGLFGGSIGLLISLITHLTKRRVKILGSKEKRGEVVLIIDCGSQQVEQVKRLLMRRLAVGVGVMMNPAEDG